MNRRLFVAALALLPLAAVPAHADAKFVAFIQTLWPSAKAAGITRKTFDRAFAGITEPDPVALKLANNQPELTATTSAYLAKAVTQARIDAARELKESMGDKLKAFEDRYQVDRHILLAIWGMESNFGKDKGSMSVMRSLATLAYSGYKKDYAREQIIAALKMLQKGVISEADFTGSWAGAMGHTQFIPTSYLASAVDWTGDGKKDIWNSSSDALASTANYLAKAGWKGDRPWGWEIKLPKNFDKALIGRDHWKKVGDWTKLGIVRADGGKFPNSNVDAFVMVPQGVSGPRFLVTQNFLAIMDYNLSHSYALAVGHLADRIRGGGPFLANWPEVNYDLSAKQRIELQKRLNAMGFETGGDDGRFGARTYEAIIAYQKRTGQPLDGVPSAALLERLRSGG
jgi:membrane-bound lytic murein transglycosylase B